MDLKFLIVDDELHICRLIAKFVSDHFTPCEIKFAHCGSDALRLIKEHDPDIVITDIRIPEFDGIQLVEKAYEAKSRSKFIIVSGYKKFEYAHTALKFGVVDYLLKPIDEKELVSVIRGIIEQISSANTADKKYSEMMQQNDQYKYQLKINALKDILNGHTVEESALVYPQSHFILAATQISADSSLSDNQPFFDMAVKNLSGILRAFFTSLDTADIFVYHQYLITCVNFQPEETGRIKGTIVEAMAAAKRWTTQHGRLHISTGISSIWKDCVTSAYQAFRQALNCARCHVEGGFEKVFWADDYAHRVKVLPAVIRREIQRFDRCLENAQPRQVDGYFQQLLRTVQTIPLLHPACLYDIRVQILRMLNEFAVQLGIKDIPDPKQENFCSRAASYPDFFHELANDMSRCLAEINQQKSEIDSVPVVLAKQYIHEHLGEEIRQERVAEEVHLSAAYFSVLFKRVAGCTFSEYVIKERIRCAKKLLTTSALNISEISDRLGYTDIRAFSKRFKREVGITPSEFRTIHFDSNIDWWE